MLKSAFCWEGMRSRSGEWRCYLRKLGPEKQMGISSDEDNFSSLELFEVVSSPEGSPCAKWVERDNGELQGVYKLIEEGREVMSLDGIRLNNFINNLNN